MLSNVARWLYMKEMLTIEKGHFIKQWESHEGRFIPYSTASWFALVFLHTQQAKEQRKRDF